MEAKGLKEPLGLPLPQTSTKGQYKQMDKYVIADISTLEITHVLSALKTMRENNSPVDYIRIGEGVEFGQGVAEYLRKQKIEVR